MNNGQIIDIEGKESGLSIKEVLFKYYSYWPLFLCTLALCLLGSFFYIYLTPKEYKIQETILITDDSKSAGADNLLAELDVFKSQKVIENEIEILKSKALVSKAVKLLESDIVYFQERGLRKMELYKSCPF